NSVGHRQPRSAVCSVVSSLLGCGWGGPLPWSGAEIDGLARRLVAVLRDVFGNPFHPVELNPAWRTPAVRGPAPATHHARAFARLPVLGDALEDAGCDSTEVLSHCREAPLHVRGCWVIDAILLG